MQRAPGTVLCSKRWTVWGRRNYEVAWKMAEGSGTKWWICCSIKLLVKMKKIRLIFTYKLNKLFGHPYSFQMLFPEDFDCYVGVKLPLCLTKRIRIRPVSSLLTNHCKQVWVVHRLLVVMPLSQAWPIQHARYGQAKVGPEGMNRHGCSNVRGLMGQNMHAEEVKLNLTKEESQ